LLFATVADPTANSYLNIDVRRSKRASAVVDECLIYPIGAPVIALQTFVYHPPSVIIYSPWIFAHYFSRIIAQNYPSLVTFEKEGLFPLPGIHSSVETILGLPSIIHLAT
jgi:hypothetical protein